MGEKCPSPYKPLSPPQVQESLSMPREACLEHPHVAKASVAILCWQPLATWGPLPGPLGTAGALKCLQISGLPLLHPSRHHSLIITDLFTSHQKPLLP